MAENPSKNQRLPALLKTILFSDITIITILIAMLIAMTLLFLLTSAPKAPATKTGGFA